VGMRYVIAFVLLPLCGANHRRCPQEWIGFGLSSFSLSLSTFVCSLLFLRGVDGCQESDTYE
jgi:hypothetical protein